MKRLSRYLFRHAVMSTLLVAFVLTAAVWLSQSLRLFDLLIEGGVAAGAFLRLMLYTVPTFLGTVLPPALAVGIVFAYSRLNTESELVVMRAAGLSPWQLAKPAFAVSVIAMVLLGALSFWLTPVSYRAIATLRAGSESEFSSLLLREGVFTEVGRDRTIYVRERDPAGALVGLVYHEAPEGVPDVTIMAQHGYVATADGKPRVHVFEGNRQEFDPETGKLSVLYFDSYTIDLDQLTAPGVPAPPKTRERNIADLVREYRQGNGAEIGPEIHRRLAAPLVAPAIVSVALAILLTGGYNRRGQRGRLAAVAVAILGIEVAMIGLPHLVEKSSAVVPLLYGVPIALILLGILRLTGAMPAPRRNFAPGR